MQQQGACHRRWSHDWSHHWTGGELRLQASRQGEPAGLDKNPYSRTNEGILTDLAANVHKVSGCLPSEKDCDEKSQEVNSHKGRKSQEVNSSLVAKIVRKSQRATTQCKMHTRKIWGFTRSELQLVAIGKRLCGRAKELPHREQSHVVTSSLVGNTGKQQQKGEVTRSELQPMATWSPPQPSASTTGCAQQALETSRVIRKRTVGHLPPL
jgi:hypothetical protein